MDKYSFVFSVANNNTTCALLVYPFRWHQRDRKIFNSHTVTPVNPLFEGTLHCHGKVAGYTWLPRKHKPLQNVLDKMYIRRNFLNSKKRLRNILLIPLTKPLLNVLWTHIICLMKTFLQNVSRKRLGNVFKTFLSKRFYQSVSSKCFINVP